MICDGDARAIAFSIAPGQAHELPIAYGLLDCLPGTPIHTVCDRGYAKPTIPPRRTDPPVRCDAYIYHNRNVVEWLWGWLKEWRAVATR